MKIIKTVSDGRKTVIIYEDENGTVFSSDGNFKSDRNKVEFDDELDVFVCGCLEDNYYGWENHEENNYF